MTPSKSIVWRSAEGKYGMNKVVEYVALGE